MSEAERNVRKKRKNINGNWFFSDVIDFANVDLWHFVHFSTIPFSKLALMSFFSLNFRPLMAFSNGGTYVGVWKTMATIYSLILNVMWVDTKTLMVIVVALIGISTESQSTFYVTFLHPHKHYSKQLIQNHLEVKFSAKHRWGLIKAICDHNNFSYSFYLAITSFYFTSLTFFLFSLIGHKSVAVC